MDFNSSLDNSLNIPLYSGDNKNDISTQSIQFEDVPQLRSSNPYIENDAQSQKTFMTYKTNVTMRGMFDDINFGISKPERRKYIRKHVLYSIFELMVALLSFTIYLIYHNENNHFIEKDDV